MMNATNVKVTVFGPNLRDQSKGQFHVHAAGCAHCGRAEYRGIDSNQFEVSTKSQLAQIIFGDDAGISDLHFAPCVKL
jgi:hypothetical protein